MQHLFAFSMDFSTHSKILNFPHSSCNRIQPPQRVSGCGDVQCFGGAAKLPAIAAVTAAAREQISQINDPLLKDSPRALCYCFSLPPLLLRQEFEQSHYWSYFTAALKSLQSNRIHRLGIKKTLKGGAEWARKSAANCTLVINNIVAVFLMSILRQNIW